MNTATTAFTSSPLSSSFLPSTMSNNNNNGSSNGNNLEQMEAGQGSNSSQPEQEPPSILKQSSHPTALIFHYLFRTLAITAYLLCSWFSSNFILNFVIITLLLAFDFWTVKNITGRLLVGLRWWNEIKADGSNHWVFESRTTTVGASKTGSNSQSLTNAVDRRLFWLALYGYLVVWVLFGIIGIIGLKIEWLTIVAIAISLNLANVIGYSKCDKEAKKRLKNMVGQSLFQTFVANQLNLS